MGKYKNSHIYEKGEFLEIAFLRIMNFDIFFEGINTEKTSENHPNNSNLKEMLMGFRNKWISIYSI